MPYEPSSAVVVVAPPRRVCHNLAALGVSEGDLGAVSYCDLVTGVIDDG